MRGRDWDRSTAPLGGPRHAHEHHDLITRIEEALGLEAPVICSRDIAHRVSPARHSRASRWAQADGRGAVVPWSAIVRACPPTRPRSAHVHSSRPVGGKARLVGDMRKLQDRSRPRTPPPSRRRERAVPPARAIGRLTLDPQADQQAPASDHQDHQQHAPVGRNPTREQRLFPGEVARGLMWRTGSHGRQCSSGGPPVRVGSPRWPDPLHSVSTRPTPPARSRA
jgi:hypothetical protein